MPKPKTQYFCQSCGTSSAKWLGRCPGCEGWNTFVEERMDAIDTPNPHTTWVSGGPVPYVDLEVPADERNGPPTGRRYATGLSELDRVLGGGLLSDSFVLLGGDPGIGKSTLLLQMAKGVTEHQPELRVLYVSGEESIEQIRGRAHRLGVIRPGGSGRIFLASETQLEQVFATVKELKPHVIVMDSLQTFSSGALESAPGSISQLREVAARLVGLAKTGKVAVLLVGHVTKDGNIAGPKVVEHMVDTVLYFEGDGGQTYRLLRTVKNRFGSSRELGVFEMEGEGLREVTNPSALFLSERTEPAQGTAVTAVLEGTRPLMVELQALVASTPLAVPRRTAVGLEPARLSLIAAILEKHLKLQLAQNDLFFNVAGGLRLSEPGGDLAAAAAIWSSCEDLALPSDWIFLGELGLTGEVRRVSQMDLRLQEAKRLGFRTAVIPQGASLSKGSEESGMHLLRLSRISELAALAAGLRAPGPRPQPALRRKSPPPETAREDATSR